MKQNKIIEKIGVKKYVKVNAKRLFASSLGLSYVIAKILLYLIRKMLGLVGNKFENLTNSAFQK